MATEGAEGATDVTEVDLDGAIDKLKLEGMENNSLKFLEVMLLLLIFFYIFTYCIGYPGFAEQNQLSSQFVSDRPHETLLSLSHNRYYTFLGSIL